MVANHHVNRLAMFHVEHKHIFKMWKWTPHVVHAFNGGFIMTPKEKAKAKPMGKKDLVDEIVKYNDSFEVGNYPNGGLYRVSLANLRAILDLVK
jgi:hypothetical protein